MDMDCNLEALGHSKKASNVKILQNHPTNLYNDTAPRWADILSERKLLSFHSWMKSHGFSLLECVCVCVCARMLLLPRSVKLESQTINIYPGVSKDIL